MSVKRYWISPNGIACEDNEGKFVRYEDYAALEARYLELAAENAGMKGALNKIAFTYPLSPHIHEMTTIQTPATDAFLAEVRAGARNEGINYAASRLAAAYNHGFIGKSMSEVADVVHMILDTKEELAGSMIPAVDGLSGEYAEAFLKDSAAQLRKGVQS